MLEAQTNNVDSAQDGVVLSVDLINRQVFKTVTDIKLNNTLNRQMILSASRAITAFREEATTLPAQIISRFNELKGVLQDQ
jgi:hypothetical protein